MSNKQQIYDVSVSWAACASYTGEVAIKADSQEEAEGMAFGLVQVTQDAYVDNQRCYKVVGDVEWEINGSRVIPKGEIETSKREIYDREWLLEEGVDCDDWGDCPI